MAHPPNALWCLILFFLCCLANETDPSLREILRAVQTLTNQSKRTEEKMDNMEKKMDTMEKNMEKKIEEIKKSVEGLADKLTLKGASTLASLITVQLNCDGFSETGHGLVFKQNNNTFVLTAAHVVRMCPPRQIRIASTKSAAAFCVLREWFLPRSYVETGHPDAAVALINDCDEMNDFHFIHVGAPVRGNDALMVTTQIDVKGRCLSDTLPDRVLGSKTRRGLYDMPSVPGASGAPLFMRQESGEYMIVAVNHGLHKHSTNDTEGLHYARGLNPSYLLNADRFDSTIFFGLHNMGDCWTLVHEAFLSEDPLLSPGVCHSCLTSASIEIQSNLSVLYWE